jgi:hypothetical protein
VGDFARQRPQSGDTDGHLGILWERGHANDFITISLIVTGLIGLGVLRQVGAPEI